MFSFSALISHKMASISLLVLTYSSLIVHFTFYQVSAWGHFNPTQGFVSLPLNSSNLIIQKPYNVPVDQRSSFKNGYYKLWVFSTDKPHSLTSKTNPRTEIGIRGYNYSSGVWQFEAYGYVPNGTSGVCIMQIFGATPHATTLMLRVYNGSLSYYREAVIVSNICNRWFKLNVIHDVDKSKVKVFINGILKYVAPGRGGTSHSKFGVYAQDDASYYMESRWKNIKILKKCYRFGTLYLAY
ncbi:citrate-binding protein-like [Mangifera indica]|uniref:citrate-binding protein-like n=1 Tax=Mangifera indica TaxID=29780 RepID=UPI001CFBC3AC|nr:citrate-binding protein-like [Mangifera indica]